ncbi:hypothetical protein CRENPOLYSF1_150052 [Crenothrix polyspora]|uniref:Uncharacterized protein n=1 Tax=Crenothrix polyspora TaxID=360316 RepID=A0A1R4H330_9GAMM|nr:hypothetical protein CRENPOLYSF1_150052 [Crenothrix polyspora]
MPLLNTNTANRPFLKLFFFTLFTYESKEVVSVVKAALQQHSPNGMS